MKGAVLLLLLLLPSSLGAAGAPAGNGSSATISGSRQFILSSVHSKRDFLIQIASPVRAPKPREKVAVLYVLDGDYMFGMATDIARNLQIVREIAPVYVVAIGYPGEAHAEWVTGRLREMILEPVDVNGEKLGGGAAAFQRFLTEELRPFVESRYPIDSSRAYLAGHSLGGLFAAEVILKQPDAFAGYSIGSPSLWIRPSLVEQLQRGQMLKSSSRVYVGVGSEEAEKDMVGWAKKLADTLRLRGFDVLHRVFGQEGHVSVEGSLLANALKYLIPATDVRPAAANIRNGRPPGKPNVQFASCA